MRARTRIATAVALASAALTAPAVAQADESPDIDDTATLLGAKVVAHGRAAVVRFLLTCPSGDTYTARVLTLQATSSPATSDVLASGTSSGVCKGRPQQVKVRVVNRGTDILGEPYYVPLVRGCGIEYGVSFTGPDWVVAFDRGGADGGPDGPGPALCFR